MASPPYNIIALMTDQQRALRHFPMAWADKYLTNLNKLKANGLQFNYGITNTARCSPVRGMLWTSTFPPRNGLMVTEQTFTTSLETMGTLMQKGSGSSITPAYFEMFYQGKWHLSGKFDQFSIEEDALDTNCASERESENETMANEWGMPGWDSPDAGTTLGGTVAVGGGPNSESSRSQNDIRYTNNVIDYLNDIKSGQNFCVVASLVNPHDVWAYYGSHPDPAQPSQFWATLKNLFPDFYNYVIAGDSPGDNEFFQDLMDAFSETSQPLEDWLANGNYVDDLSKKPWVHTVVRDSYNHYYTTTGVTEADAKAYAVNYLRFYAYLTYLSDQLLGEIYAAIEGNSNINLDQTILVRYADHGDVGCSHQGMVEKDCNMYNETINVPIIFSNPTLWPSPVVDNSMYSHIDLLPTLLDFAGLDSTSYTNKAPSGAPNAGAEVSMFQGTSWYDYLTGGTTTPPSSVSLFTYDDGYGGQQETPFSWHIRGIVAAPGTYSYTDPVSGDPVTFTLNDYYKYGVYFTYMDHGRNGGINYFPYLAGSEGNPNGVQFECYKDYNGFNTSDGGLETNNLFYSEWGQVYKNWSALHQHLHGLLTLQMTNADNAGPNAIDYAAITPDNWGKIVTE